MDENIEQHSWLYSCNGRFQCCTKTDQRFCIPCTHAQRLKVGYRHSSLNRRQFISNRRDFRLLIADPNQPNKPMINPVIWFNTGGQTATTIGYSLTIENPLSGWEAFYIQVNFPGPDGTVLEFTTDTQIIPDLYPTNDCVADSCFETLI